MREKFIGAIDQGTTGTRFMLFSREGQPIASAYVEHTQIFPKPGYVEHDAIEIWKNTQTAIRATLRKVNGTLNNLAAIGVTNQRETTVIWNKHSGKPITNAIVWQCTRTESLCNELKERGLEPLIRNRTGLVLATYFSGPKITWLLDNIPGARDKADRGDLLFGTIDTWLIWNLTGGNMKGVHATDVTNASRTMLMDLKTLTWNNEILAELKIPLQILPEIYPSCNKNYYGWVELDGFVGTTPVCGAIGDQQAALVGQTCFDPGMAKNTYGTGCFLLLNTGKKIVKSHHGLLTTVAYGIGTETVYAIEGSIAIAGAAIQWLRDQMELIDSAAQTEEIAASVVDNGGVYFVPAFVGLFSPYWDSSARGIILGLTRGSTRAHLIRAVLESIAFQSWDVLEAMEQDSGIKLQTLKVDGGASKNSLLMQIQSDLLGIPCIRPTVEETTALGAAYMAGLATGYWESIDELKAKWAVDRVFHPTLDLPTREKMLHQWHRAVDKARGWIEE